ncbi:MAG TPA: response regulator [Terriglobales bacterium]|nr:response regulator [Terriglobales bacterium]
MSTVRILVVDDYEPFRRFICSTLGKRQELQIVGEASDGLEAVHKAEELQPDLIVLDIGLPILNGIVAARQIRSLSPRSKILFVSQESSADIAQEAFTLGALGYIVKAYAGNELLPAVDAVLSNRRFISSGLSGRHFTDVSDSQALDGRRNKVLPSRIPKKAEITCGHQVEFYPDDAAFVVGFTDFVEAHLRAGKVVIVVATESHRKSIQQRLQDHSVDIVAATEEGRYLSLDVGDMLSSFMRNDQLEPALFFKVVGNLIAKATRSTGGEPSRIAACGECASVLWAQGKADAAIHVEQLCNQLSKRHEMDILCGFSLTSFYREEDKKLFQRICRESSAR